MEGVKLAVDEKGRLLAGTLGRKLPSRHHKEKRNPFNTGTYAEHYFVSLTNPVDSGKVSV